MKLTVHTCDVCGVEGVKTRDVHVAVSEGHGISRKTLVNQNIDVCEACWHPQVIEGKRRVNLQSLFRALKPKVEI